MLKLMKKTFNFLVVGLVAFIIDYGLLVVLTEKFGVYYIISSIISFVISVIVNYYLSISFVFEAENTSDNFISFLIISIAGLIINAIIMSIGVEHVHAHYTVVKIFSTIIIMIYNFISKSMILE